MARIYHVAKNGNDKNIGTADLTAVPIYSYKGDIYGKTRYVTNTFHKARRN